MVDTPDVWSENSFRNVERVGNWARAISAMCRITDNDYTLYRAHMSCKITDDELQCVIYDLSPNFGKLMDWIADGTALVAESDKVPTACKPPVLALSPLRDAWIERVTSKKMDLSELSALCDEFADQVDICLTNFQGESPGSYSSYSDYSSETVDTETEEEEEEEEEETPPPRRRRHVR